MMVLTFLTLGIIAYCYIELYLCKVWRKNIKCLIHVNGVRGKSTVTRMLYSAIKENNYSCIAKTTGSEPTYIMPNGEINLIKRKSAPNIREQIKMLKMASKNSCDFYIVECMAVNPILQRYSEMFLKADFTVITNVKIDHIGVLGFTKDQVAESLLKSKPDKGILYTDDYYNEKINDRHKYIKSFYDEDDIFSKNANTVLTICEQLGLDLERCKKGINKYDLDIGHREVYNMGNGVFINGFSANDYESTCEILSKYMSGNKDDISLFYNNRSDRKYRLELMLDLIIKYNPKDLYISGEAMFYLKQKIKKTGYTGHVNIVKKYQELNFNGKLIVGIGNIKGVPIDILKEMEKLC